MTESKRALVAFKVSALFFKAMKDFAKSVIAESRQMNKINKLLKKWEKDTKHDKGKKRDSDTRQGLGI